MQWLGHNELHEEGAYSTFEARAEKVPSCPEVEAQYPAIFTLSFEILQRIEANRKSNAWVASLAMCIALCSGVLSAAPLSKQMLLCAASKLKGSEAWYHAGQQSKSDSDCSIKFTDVQYINMMLL
eukprot:COSAG05_NODE_404_length_10192_cov_3.830377_7_plen_125_part_00